jgi:hypothetical protein
MLSFQQAIYLYYNRALQKCNVMVVLLEFLHLIFNINKSSILATTINNYFCCMLQLALIDLTVLTHWLDSLALISQTIGLPAFVPSLNRDRYIVWNHHNIPYSLHPK